MQESMGPIVDRSEGIPRHLRPGDLPRAPPAARCGQEATARPASCRSPARTSTSPRIRAVSFAFPSDADWREVDPLRDDGGGRVASGGLGVGAGAAARSSSSGSHGLVVGVGRLPARARRGSARSASSVRCSMPMKSAARLSIARSSSSSLAWIAAPSRFCEFWIRNTIRKVTIVVPVLITSCQVSE